MAVWSMCQYSPSPAPETAEAATRTSSRTVPRSHCCSAESGEPMCTPARAAALVLSVRRACLTLGPKALHKLYKGHHLQLQLRYMPTLREPQSPINSLSGANRL